MLIFFLSISIHNPIGIFQGNLAQDCYTTVCCLQPCAAMQIEKEFDYQGIPGGNAQ